MTSRERTCPWVARAVKPGRTGPVTLAEEIA
jgi:hypothetical protein